MKSEREYGRNRPKLYRPRNRGEADTGRELSDCLTIKEVAQKTGYGTRTIWNWIREDRLKSWQSRKRGRHCIRKEDTENLPYKKKVSNGVAKETRPTQYYPSEEEIRELVARYAAEWKSLGCPYHLVENYGKEIKGYLNKDSLWKGEEKSEVEAFLLMASVHFNAGWEKWTIRNGGNRLAVKALIEILHSNYWRTRFRALYALQFMNHDQIADELAEERHRSLSKQTIQTLKSYVPNRKVTPFLREIADQDNQSIAEKASQVLAEIASLWKDPEAGIKTTL